MKCLILCVLLAGGAFAETAVWEDKNFITANLNEYIDNILPAIVDYIINNEMDPMEIPDLLEGFSVKPLFIEYHGELELTNGILKNLRSLRRSGDITVSYLNKILKVSGDFGINKITFDYDYLAKIMDIGPTGGVLGSMSKASIFAEFLIDFNNNEIHLQDFYFHDVGTIKVKLTGHLLDFLSNAMIRVITTLFKGIILNTVEANMKKALEDYLNSINNSIGGAQKFLEMNMTY